MKDKLVDFWYRHKKGITITLCIILGILVFRTVNIAIQKHSQSDTELMTDEELVDYEKTHKGQEFTGTKTTLWEEQDKLTKKYGDAGEGYMWNDDGTRISLGDDSMSGEDVVYTYLQSLSKLDLENAQKYSRKPSVVKRYQNFYSDNYNADYQGQFNRKMYATALKSMQIKTVESTATLSQNKQVYTVEASIIDLTDKDFWKNDKGAIFENLHEYKYEQGDQTKANQYLYDYISGYYEKDTAIRRNITFDITVEKFTDYGTAWLVSKDDDLDNACVYKDGKSIVSYIKEEYTKYWNSKRD